MTGHAPPSLPKCATCGGVQVILVQDVIDGVQRRGPCPDCGPGGHLDGVAFHVAVPAAVSDVAVSCDDKALAAAREWRDRFSMSFSRKGDEVLDPLLVAFAQSAAGCAVALSSGRLRVCASDDCSIFPTGSCPRCHGNGIEVVTT